MEKNRKKLPYRKNCEGYFFDNNGNVLAKDTGKNFVKFPGGGIKKDETPEQALIREAFEETGVIIDGKLKKLGVLKFDWGKSWAKTEKQKERYKIYRGEEMHFFTGKIRKFVKPKGDSSDVWKGKLLMQIDDAINLIKNYPKDKAMEEYRKMQRNSLKLIKNKS